MSDDLTFYEPTMLPSFDVESNFYGLFVIFKSSWKNIMIACANCGKLNSPETNFCRFCGTKSAVPQPARYQQFPNTAPQPYAWKTDEFQTKAEARRTSPFMPGGGLPAQYSQQLDAGYRCPRCGSTFFPVTERRISTAGWVVFSVLLITTVIFFWIGLLLKENVMVCPACRSKVG